MQDYLSKTFKAKDIDDYISTNAEEGQYLEFKSAAALSAQQKNKDEISKDVSAFANADGGLLIYGISEVDHKASKPDFVDGDVITKEWLQQVIDSGVQRKISGLVIDPVRFDKDIHKTVYVVKIPRSINSPHQAADKRFYKRTNFNVSRMEEYEVRDSYNRTSKTELELLEPKVQQTSEGTSGRALSSLGVVVYFSVLNKGQAIEKLYKVEVWVPTIIAKAKNPDSFFSKHLRSEGRYEIYSFPNSSPLYQEETTTLPQLNLTVTSANYLVLVSEPLKVKLYYSSGTSERELYLTTGLLHKEHQVSEACFNGGR